MLMPGHNVMTLCPAALMAILQRHLQSTQGKTNDPSIRVTDLTIDSDGVHFVLTTDAPTPKET